MARQAVYRPGSLRTLSEEQTTLYFTRRAPETFELRPNFRKGVAFSDGNILNLATFRPATPYDVVFCRNVLIYFDQPVRQRLLSGIEGLLAPGGLLCIGHTETLNGVQSRLRMVRPSVFRLAEPPRP
jgi:chemotaxis protein methyltransferase CheR